MTKKYTFKAKVESTYDDVTLEFGRVQAGMWFSENGKAQRALKLIEGDKVLVTIEKV